VAAAWQYKADTAFSSVGGSALSPSDCALGKADKIDSFDIVLARLDLLEDVRTSLWSYI